MGDFLFTIFFKNLFYDFLLIFSFAKNELKNMKIVKKIC